MAPLAQAVIGAGFGDEGKGLMVDALAAAASANETRRPVVVRSNGGAQAGHTVTLADGRRQVFHHVGAGALAGADTHLSRFFVHHPMLLQAERADVVALGGRGALSADPRGLVTTPWDMLVNQAVEAARAGSRHGSCGLGFGETIERGQHAEFSLTVADLAASDLARRLQRIRQDWIPRRLTALGLAGLPRVHAERLADERLLDLFLEDCAAFLDTIALAGDAGLARRGPVIFEGAQGLELDMAIGAFPHVTRSHTGLANMAAIAREAGLDGIEATYVTRAYRTRHGAGPLRGGGPALEGFAIGDPTNAPNPWQGAIRYAPLDADRLGAVIAADLRLANLAGLTVRTGLAVTCLDQALTPVEALAADLAKRLGLSLNAEGWGPARTGVRLARKAAMRRRAGEPQLI